MALRKLRIVPVTLKQANEFVARHHRHHGPTVSHKFSIGVADGDRLVGVAICGRPVAMMLDDGLTLEVNRTCTDGTPNANSKLYGACARIARNMGYLKILTYTLPEEGGTSLRAAGWECVGKAGGGTWNRPNQGRLRVDKHPTGPKLRWELRLCS